MELAARLEDPADIQAFLCWNINPAASSPEQARFRRALTRDDLFTVVVDIFQTDTADYADYVLPAASFLEFDDLVSGYFNLSMSAQAKLQEPLGDSLPNQEIFRRSRAPWATRNRNSLSPDDEIIERIMGQVGIVGSFEDFKKAGTVFPTTEPIIQFPDLAFPTPSGKIEIVSARAEADGHPRLPRADADLRPENGRLRLLTPASPWLMNDSYANDARIADRMGEATVTLHPADAEARGLADGQRVRLSNKTGSLELALAVAESIPQGVALSPKGRWPRQEGTRANVNVLNPGTKSDMGESTCVHGVEVEIAAV